MEKLWRLHDYSEDKKIKLASSEFDGYALHWWDSVLTEIEETNGQPIRTWCDMKAIMKARFVPTNYLRSVYDKLQQLKQGTMTVDDMGKTANQREDKTHGEEVIEQGQSISEEEPREDKAKK